VKTIIGQGRILVLTQTGDTTVTLQDNSSNGVTTGAFQNHGESEIKLSNGETAMFIGDADGKWKEVRRDRVGATWSPSNVTARMTLMQPRPRNLLTWSGR